MPLRDVKYAALEIDGVELEELQEKPVAAEDCTFSDGDFTSDNVQDGIVEAKNTAVGFTEFEAFTDDSTESTTSNSWVTKNNYPYTTTTKTAGDYLVDYTAQLGQSDKEKEVGYRVQWREGTSGTWITLVDVRDGVSQDGAYQLRTGFNIITLSTDTVFQVRVQWGQTDEGGTGFIRNAAIKVSRVA